VSFHIILLSLSFAGLPAAVISTTDGKSLSPSHSGITAKVITLVGIFVSSQKTASLPLRRGYDTVLRTLASSVAFELRAIISTYRFICKPYSGEF